ncbi:anion permease [Yersinia kristensenii]|uniref:anion permease n=1 Tax=Yersinia kristensenii TaxID=28152 RepID=UPI0005E959D0|nr:anion permease [Yersinia kristensenii]CNH52263.1 putative membrane transport protein [Yersinia kristensenii]CNK44592.1 putative membrane transport protein [Yersinia kristensenii]
MSIFKTRIGRMLLILLIGISIWFSPVPESVDPRVWHLMAVFAATVIGLILSPYPLGAMAIFSLTVVAATGLLSIKEVLAGFADPTIWMIACAFFISRGFIKTGFGRRVGYLFISKLGHSSLGLAYGLVLTDLLFAPAMPSTSARCGGIITPLFRSISEAYESTPERGTERKIGAFLVQCIFQCNAITCAMFLTSMAGNPMIAKLAGEMGITITWTSWALAAIVPGLISLAVIPLLLYRFYPPELKKTPEMRALALVKLKEMGPMSRNEWIVLSVFIGLVTLWVCGSALNIDATMTAFIGLAILLLSGALTWDDVIAEKEAWHTVIWFAVLLTLASQLNKLGFISWFGASIAGSVQGMNWVPMMGILLLAYYYSHYMMASAIAHISAMYAIFVSIAIAAGAPPMLTVLVFGMFSNLYMATTHYSGGPAPILFGCNFIPLATWWKIGFLISLVVIPIWLIIGSAWWSVLGFW